MQIAFESRAATEFTATAAIATAPATMGHAGADTTLTTPTAARTRPSSTASARSRSLCSNATRSSRAIRFDSSHAFGTIRVSLRKHRWADLRPQEYTARSPPCLARKKGNSNVVRVLIVHPAGQGAGAPNSGGVAGYVGDLVAALTDAGSDVGVITAGHAYSPSALGGRSRAGRCRVEELEPLGGIRRFQIVNSPVLAPALWQFGDPEGEIDARPVNRAFRAACRRFAPDVVHIHGFEGFGAGIVAVARSLGVPAICSIHNYQPFCSQVNLLRRRRVPCDDFAGGLACESCEEGVDIAAERNRRASGRGHPPSIRPPQRAPVMTFREDLEPSAQTRGLWDYSHPLWAPHSETVSIARGSRCGQGRYGVRRSAYVGALNECHAVLPVSSATAEICRQMGVGEARINIQPIGSWAAAIEPQNRPRAPERHSPIHLAFLGFGSYGKGLGVLCDALLLLVPEIQRRVSIDAHGPGVAEDMARLAHSRPRFASVRHGGRYDRADTLRHLDRVHAAVVPSIWHDNGPQTAIEARALGVPVIGSRIGGIPDIVSDGVDGLLVQANDRIDLARVIARCVTDPELLARMRSRVRPWITMSQHVDALFRIYESALLLRRRARHMETS